MGDFLRLPTDELDELEECPWVADDAAAPGDIEPTDDTFPARHACPSRSKTKSPAPTRGASTRATSRTISRGLTPAVESEEGLDAAGMRIGGEGGASSFAHPTHLSHPTQTAQAAPVPTNAWQSFNPSWSRPSFPTPIPAPRLSAQETFTPTRQSLRDRMRVVVDQDVAMASPARIASPVDIKPNISPPTKPTTRPPRRHKRRPAGVATIGKHYISPRRARPQPYRHRALEDRITDSYHPTHLTRLERTAIIGPLPPTLSVHDLASYLLRRVGAIQELSIKNEVAKVVFERADAWIARRNRELR